MPFFEKSKTLRKIKEKIFNTTVDTLSRIMEQLASANNELMESAKSFFPDENPYAPIRLTMSEALDHLKTTIRGRGSNLEGMKFASSKLMKQGSDIGTMLTDRDRAHNLMAHYEVKVKKLKDSKKTPAEKFDRNKLKHSVATHSFEEMDREARDRLNGVLTTREKEFVTLLGLLCSYLSTITKEMEECTRPLASVYKRAEFIRSGNHEGHGINPFPPPSLNPFDEVNSVDVVHAHRQPGQLSHMPSHSAKTVITLASSDIQQKTPVAAGAAAQPGGSPAIDIVTPATVGDISRSDVGGGFDPSAIMEEETIRMSGQSSAGSPTGSPAEQKKTPEKRGRKSKLMKILAG
ncbi:hypothetical protein FOZ63_027546 [Perkinsus olseni]|uniref:BAR domain-containing protein n=1 Tax=Perkinsus olseni TaxID=32597 RepID=A0A7J6UA29_PEROL|nr:hypothetical protein FOZ63_027546 [Perkinsus olseni]KAF4753761.1 hypothetical protein FOZ62_018529 [Perkinsus olseni]